MVRNAALKETTESLASRKGDAPLPRPHRRRPTWHNRSRQVRYAGARHRGDPRAFLLLPQTRRDSPRPRRGLLLLLQNVVVLDRSWKQQQQQQLRDIRFQEDIR